MTWAVQDRARPLRARSSRARLTTLALLTVVLALAGSLANALPNLETAAALPNGSAPDVYVTGSDGAALFPFPNDSFGLASTFPAVSSGATRVITSVVNSANGGETVGIGTENNIPTVFVLDPATGTTIGTVPFSPGDTLVGLAADPINPNIVFVVGTVALFLVNVNSMSAQQLYALPPSEPGYFLSLVVTTDAATAYVGGALTGSGTAVNTIFALSLPPPSPPSGWTSNLTGSWSAPAGDSQFLRRGERPGADAQRPAVVRRQ